MKIEALKEKWEVIENTDLVSGYRSIILDPTCFPEFYIGLNDQGMRCLILKIPNEFKVNCNVFDKEKISLAYFSEKNYIVLMLHDSAYFELFDELIMSLHTSIERIPEVNVYLREFFKTLSKWIQFFEDTSKIRLSSDQVQGLFGELYYLRSILLSEMENELLAGLRSWQGPFDRGHDFVFDSKNIEVKTKVLGKVGVSISSEFQLDGELGKEHQLLVISVRKDVITGQSIKDLAFHIRDIASAQLVDISIFLLALKQKNLTFSNIHEYDNLRYVFIESQAYDCMKEGFPRIVRSKLDKSISHVSYELNLTKLSDFIVSEERL